MNYGSQKLNWVISSLIFIVLIILVGGDEAKACAIHLKDGRVIKAVSCWEENGKVKYEKWGTTVSLEKSKVDHIEDQDNENKDQNIISGSVSSDIPEITWKSGYPYIKTNENTWSSISGRSMEVAGNKYLYKMDEDNWKNGRLYKNGVVVRIYKKGVDQGLKAVNEYNDATPNSDYSEIDKAGSEYSDTNYVPVNKCLHSCARGEKRSHLEGVNLYTITMVELNQHLIAYDKNRTGQNWPFPQYPHAQKVVQARQVAEELLQEPYFKSKHAAYQKQIENVKTIIPCIYYKNCISHPTKNKSFTRAFGLILRLNKIYLKDWRILKDSQKSYDQKINKREYEVSAQNKIGDIPVNGFSDLYTQSFQSQVRENYLEAIGGYTKLINANYNLVDCYLNRGDCYYELAQNDKSIKRYEYYNYAIRDYNASMAAGDSSGVALVKRGVATWFSGARGREKAFKDLNAVINDNLEASGMAYFWKAIIYRWDKELENAHICMTSSATLGYPEANEFLSKNPTWPFK